MGLRSCEEHVETNQKARSRSWVTYVLVTTPQQETVLLSDYLKKLRFHFTEEYSVLGPLLEASSYGLVWHRHIHTCA